MINSVQYSNNISYNLNKKSNINFCSVDSKNKQDSFETQNQRHNVKADSALLLLSGLTTAGAGIGYHKLGKTIRAVGEIVPISPWGRLKKVFKLTTIDKLSGLFNKATLMTDLDKKYKESMDKGETFSVAMLDMDNFKGINEQLGHHKGDIFISQIAKNIKAVIEKHSLKGYRYGGEEFAIIMPNKDNNSAKKIIEEISESIKTDEVIQGHLPLFIKKTREDLQFIYNGLDILSSLFPKLRKEENVDNYRQLANDVITIFNRHTDKYKPKDKKGIEELIEKLTCANDKGLPNLLSVKTETGDHSTLGTELNKIYSQYNGLKNDLQKWLDHVEKHKMFTISGGVATLSKEIPLEKSEQALEIADEALNSAKVNGKNTIITASDDLISKTLNNPEKINET